jgi:RNA polymerase sigma-70 factor, ECF subfamily
MGETAAGRASMKTHQRVEVFEELRPRMFGLAYRMLGSVADAEDIVQEAFLRWQNAEDIREPAAFLTTVVTRLSLDQLKSARVRRERYVGPWLPEPLLADHMPDASEAAELSDSLSMAFLMVLESLTPAERAAFLLREVFSYGYDEIADLLRTKEANIRQLVHRAKERIGERRQRFEADKEKQRELLGKFLFAVSTGEVDALIELLAEDAVCYTDGGGEVRAARRPIFGSDKIARFLAGIVGDMPRDLESQVMEANGAPAILLRSPQGAWGVLTADTSEEKIEAIYMVLNPKKISAVDRH